MVTSTCLKNQFLIAMPTLNDPHFSGTVTYICEHNDAGAMGIIINQPLNITLGDVLNQMDIVSINQEMLQQPVLSGGPVSMQQGFILHEAGKCWKATIHTSDEIAMTTSKDILEAIAQGEGPRKSIISLGYAGWAAGQLEQEILENLWLHAPADPEIIFEQPFVMRWASAAGKIGIDVKHLSTEIGHA